MLYKNSCAVIHVGPVAMETGRNKDIWLVLSDAIDPSSEHVSSLLPRQDL